MEETCSTVVSRWSWPRGAELVDAAKVFDAPSCFAETLSKTLPIAPGTERILDIGCGTGVVGLDCLVHRQARHVTFSDVQIAALVETYGNLARQVAAGAVRDDQVGYELGGFQRIPADVVAQHSLLAFNPPQLPTEAITAQYRAEVESSKAKSIFRCGGPDGLAVARQFFHWYARLPSPRPKAVIVLSSFLGRRRIDEAIRAQGLAPHVLHETVVPLRVHFSDALEELAGSEPELNDRSLSRNGGSWQKKLLTISLDPGVA